MAKQPTIFTVSNNDAYKIAFNEAESFFAASRYVDEMLFKNVRFSEIKKFMGITLASEVNHCFAMEMYLKTLSIITKGSYITGHPLDKLYDYLLPDVQNELISHFDLVHKYNDIDLSREVQGLPPKEFNELLIDAKDTFIDNRYKFSQQENSNGSYSSYKLDGAILTIREIIIKKHPELNQLAFATITLKKR